jgi:hypothetical protein
LGEMQRLENAMKKRSSKKGVEKLRD